MVLTTTERTNELMKVELKKNLSLLELSDLVKIIEEQERDIKLVDLSYDERLELLLDALVQERENRLIGRLIRNAGFKYPNACLESLDYDSRQIKKSTIINLAIMVFVMLDVIRSTKNNVIMDMTFINMSGNYIGIFPL